MKSMYKATASSIGGRDGHIESESGHINIALRIPKEMGGSGEEGTNPEELFAAAYSACFNSALAFAARMKHIEIGEAKVTASVSIGQSDKNEECYDISVKIEAEIAGVSQDIADMLVKRANELCPYSHATRGNIDIELVATTV